MRTANDFWNDIPSAIQAKIDVNQLRIKDGVPEYSLHDGQTLTSLQQTTMDDLVSAFKLSDPSSKELKADLALDRARTLNGKLVTDLTNGEIKILLLAIALRTGFVDENLVVNVK